MRGSSSSSWPVSASRRCSCPPGQAPTCCCGWCRSQSSAPAAVLLAGYLWRRRRLEGALMSPEAIERRPGRAITPGARRPEVLADEREFLRRSIEDLENELASGEVDEEDFAVLRARYGARLDRRRSRHGGPRAPRRVSRARRGSRRCRWRAGAGSRTQCCPEATRGEHRPASPEQARGLDGCAGALAPGGCGW